MTPDRDAAERILAEAVACNPGPWEGHSRIAAGSVEKCSL